MKEFFKVQLSNPRFTDYLYCHDMGPRNRAILLFLLCNKWLCNSQYNLILAHVARVRLMTPKLESSEH